MSIPQGLITTAVVRSWPGVVKCSTCCCGDPGLLVPRWCNGVVLVCRDCAAEPLPELEDDEARAWLRQREDDAEPWSVWEYRRGAWTEVHRASRTDALSTVARREQAGGLGFYLALPMSQMPTPDQAPAPMRSVTVERERVKA